MKKQLFTLFTLLLAICSTAWAGTYEWSCDGQKKTLTVSAQKNGGNASEYSDYSMLYNSVTYTKAVKIESATTITFSTNATANITIGITTKDNTAYSSPEKATVKFDDVETSSILTTEQEKAKGTYTWDDITFTDVEPGTHTITRGGSEMGVFYIKVEETGTVLQKLSTPEISFNSTTGTITIGSVTNATKITYTTDGSVPDANSSEYDDNNKPVVSDGTIVKAIAIGDGTTYINSDIATKTVYIEGVTCEEPTFNVVNGTVEISTTTPLATIEYNTDGGDTYTTYTKAITFFEGATVYARAKREGATTSSVSSQQVEAAPSAAAGSSSITLYYNTTDMTAASATPKGLTGNDGTDYEGWGITLDSSSKDLSSGTAITVGGNSCSTLKGSNGVPMIFTMPSGIKANRITLYSYNNGTDGGTNESYWCINEANKTNMVSLSGQGVSTAANPDVRVFSLDNLENSFYIKNGGYQQCVVAVIDYTSSQVSTPSIAPVDGGTFTSETQEVTITSATEGATIYYTTNGTIPTANSTEYTGAFTIDATTTIKAIAVKDGLDDSEIATATITKTSSTEVVTTWDFTSWSSATQNGLIADTEGWNQNEKTGNNTGTDFGNNGRSNINALSTATLQYNSTNVAETDGLKFTAGAYGMGVMFNFPKATVSSTEYTYHGSSYIWLYNSNAKIIIPNVAQGATIEMGVESHKGSEARYVSLDNTEQTQGATTEDAAKLYQVCKWTVTTAGDITVTPSSGLHIYYIKVTQNEEAVVITPAKDKTTYVTTKALDFAAVSPAGLKAYVATKAEAGNVTLSEVGAVPAGTPLMLIGTADTEYTVPVAALATAPETNMFRAGDGETEFTGNTWDYILSDGTFYKISGGVLPTTKAYLHCEADPTTTTQSARNLSVVFENEEATGVNTVQGSAVKAQGCYNLNGQRVAQPTKGLYIINGRKVVVK